MSPPQDQPLSQSIRPELHGLDPTSFTAQRLSHATPEHLYLTTRRCFVGPIPEGWLKSHRKHWIKHHLHVNYSSRAATFHASNNVSKQRRVTGLVSRSSEDRHKPNFPRPADADTVDDETQDGDDQAGHVREAEDETLLPGRSGISPMKGTIEIPRANYPDHAAIQSENTRADPPNDDTEERRIPSISHPKESAEPHEAEHETGPEEQAGNGSQSSKFTEANVKNRDSSGLLSVTTMPSLISSAASDRSTSLLVPKTDEGNNEFTDGSRGTTRTATRSLLTKVKTRKLSKTQAPAPIPAPEAVDEPMAASAPAGAANSEVPRPHVLFDLPRASTKDQIRKRAKQIQADLGRGAARALRRTEATGQVIKMEKMLVRVEHTPETRLPDDYDENVSQTIVTQTTDQWREYMVVCRHASVASDGKFALQLYNTRVIPAVDKSTEQKRASYTVALSKTSSGVNLYSSLDKTVVVWRPAKKGTRIFILRPKSNAEAAEWYTFIRDVLGTHRSTQLLVNVPDLDVQLRLDEPFKLFEAQQKEYMENQDAEGGNEEPTQHLITTSIMERCMKMLEEVPQYRSLIADWTSQHRVGLAWKRYDRIEWIHGHAEQKMYGTIAMLRSHELELRPKQHYPTSAKSKKGRKLEEPPAVEGFLIRLTSQKGHHQRMGRLFFKRLYFSTHDHYLVFSKPGQAAPPPPPSLPVAADGAVPSAHDISEQIPIIYSVNPYPVEDGSIAWLSDHTSNRDREHHDHDAHDETLRKEDLIRNCDGFIDLCNVRKVRHMKLGHTPVDDELSDGSEVDFDATGDETTANEGGTDELDFKRTLELILDNGLIIRLQAFNQETKNEWMKRLHALIKYWKARHSQDTDIYKEVRKDNLHALHIDEETEALVGQFARKWEVNQTHASPLLYNMCGISRCRTIHMSGPLYYKPRRRDLFTGVNAILISGRLVICSSQVRKSTGRTIKHIHQNKIDSIDLTDSYLYSGLLTQNDLLYQNGTFDATNPGHNALPRIWRDEGWTSRDEDVMTCFVIWQSTSRSWFRRDTADTKKSAANTEEKKSRIARVTQLGTKGKSIVFKTRSRVERDHWVLAIATEIERLQKSDDVRITPE